MALSATALVLPPLGAVEATHAVDHRYVVLGIVRDSRAVPVARGAVRVVREKTGLVYQAETDGEGFYLVILHLHDEGVLEPLRVVMGRVTLRIEARFNPLDPRTSRGTRVDVGDSGARERPKEFAATLGRYLRK